MSLSPVGARYWTGISIASVFGANLGDFLSHDLHLGHIRGLPLLAAALSLILILRRRSTANRELFYWLAIIVLRTAATNLGDLMTHDLRIASGWVMGAAILLLLRNMRRTTIQLDGLYWSGMLLAGIFGTALGDAVSGRFGVGEASIMLTVGVAALFRFRTHAAVGVGFCWIIIMAIRTAGTSVADFCAGSVGLEASTLCTGLMLVGTLSLWTGKPIATLHPA